MGVDIAINHLPTFSWTLHHGMDPSTCHIKVQIYACSHIIMKKKKLGLRNLVHNRCSIIGWRFMAAFSPSPEYVECRLGDDASRWFRKHYWNYIVRWEPAQTNEPFMKDYIKTSSPTPSLFALLNVDVLHFVQWPIGAVVLVLEIMWNSLICSLFSLVHHIFF